MAHGAVGPGHAFDARVRARLTCGVVAQPRVWIKAGRTLFHARTGGLEHGRRTAGQTVEFGEVTACFARVVARFALRAGPELACFCKL